MSLARVPTEQSVVIRGVRGRGPIASRLMEMGFIEGAAARVLGRAPFGDPMQVRIGDYSLSIRSAEADLVDVAAV